MPKPFFMARPSGLFVRFLVPADLRVRIGSRFVVRRLYATQPDRARLAAARMGAALSDAFAHMRGGTVDDIDIKALLDKQRHGQLQDLILRNVAIGQGTHIGEIEINSAEDLALFNAMSGSRLQWKDDAPAPPAPSSLPAAPTAPAAPAAAPAAPPKTQAVPEQEEDEDDEPPPLLADAIADYKADRVGKRDSESDYDVNVVLSLFLEMTGDIRVDKVKKRHLIAFEQSLLHRPNYANSKRLYKGLSAKQVVEKCKALRAAGETVVTLSDRSRDKYRDTLAAFFNWLVNDEVLGRAPTAKGLRQPENRIRVRQTRRPYTPTELERIFNPDTYGPWAEGMPHRFWLPWLALYSGARLNEIAQLYCDDIETILRVPGFHVRAGRPDQHIKNGSSMRFIPLARPVLDAGFLKYVKDVEGAGHARLFPHLKYTNSDYGDYMGDSFGAYLVSIGMKAPETATDAEKQPTLGMGVHWFRNGMGALVNLGQKPTEVASVTGHGPENMMPGSLPVYVDAPTLRARVKVVNKVSGPTPPVYTPGMFAAELAQAHELPAKWAAARIASIVAKP